MFIGLICIRNAFQKPANYSLPICVTRQGISADAFLPNVLVSTHPNFELIKKKMRVYHFDNFTYANIANLNIFICIIHNFARKFCLFKFLSYYNLVLNFFFRVFFIIALIYFFFVSSKSKKMF